MMNNKPISKGCKKNCSFRKNTPGFSLIELLIALAIFSYVFLGIAKLQLLLAHKSKNSEQTLHAANIAQNLMNRIDRNQVAIDEYIRLASTNITTTNNCSLSSCDPLAHAKQDLFQVQQELLQLPFSSLNIQHTSQTTSVQVFWHTNPVVGANKNCPRQTDIDYQCFSLSRFTGDASYEEK